MFGSAKKRRNEESSDSETVEKKQVTSEPSGQDGGEASMESNVASTEAKDQLVCEPCRQDGQTIAARGYCVQCQHYLCQPCLSVHCRPLPTRQHQLQDLNKTPLSSASKSETSPAVKCLQHNKKIEYFCKSHDQVICEDCKNQIHHVCEDVKIIIDLDISDEYKKFSENIKNLQTQFEVNNDIHAHIDRFHSLALDSISQYRDQINRRLDVLEKASKELARKCKENDRKDLITISDRCEAALTDIQRLMAELDMLHQSKQNTELFIAMKRAKHLIFTLNESLSTVKEKKYETKYTFKINTSLSDELKQSCDLGEMKRIDINGKKLRSRISSNINKINGVAILTGDRIIAVGQKGNQPTVNMMELIVHAKVVSSLEFEHEIFDVTEVGQEVATTIPDEKKIQFVTVSKSLEKGREIKVEGACMGITYSDEKLFVTFENDPIRILDMDGKVLRSIETEQMGNRQSCPQYIAISPTHNKIYVSNFRKDSVTSLTLEGKFIDSMINKNTSQNTIATHSCLIVDKYGFIYIYKDSSLYRYEEDFSGGRRLDASDIWYSNRPCVGYSQKDNTLFTINGNRIDEIQMEY